MTTEKIENKKLVKPLKKQKGVRNKRRARTNKNNMSSRSKIKLNTTYVAPQELGKIMNVSDSFKDVEAFEKWAGVVNLLKSRGPDIRLAGSGINMTGIISETAIEVNKILVPVDNEAFVGIATSVLSAAFNHGWRQAVMQEDKNYYPYFAFLFIYNSCYSVAAGNQSKVPKVMFPDFLLEILAAINPKEGPQVGSGTVGYSWETGNSAFIPPDTFFYPSAGSALGKMTFWVATSATEAGYNTMVAPTFPSYSDDAGAVAFSSLVNFMEKKLVGPKNKYHPWKKRDYLLKGTLLERSVSSFSATSMVLGSGLSGGYVSTLASLETTVIHPKLACFSKNVSLDRGFRFHRQTGGDTNWLVASMLLQQHPGEVKNPNYPVFKPVDFYEIADRIALFLCEAFTLYHSSSDFNPSLLVNLGLTPLEFLVIIRKICMRNFAATQYGVQSQRWYPSSLGASDDFCPFLVNSGTGCSSFSSSIKLPLFAVENLNALRARAVYPTVNPRTRKMKIDYPRWYIPVLGQYTKSTFDNDRYKYIDNNGNQVNLFLSGSESYNLVDGSVNSHFVDLDCSPKIASDMDIYNKVMEKLSPFVQQLQTYTGDPGVNVLTVIGDTFIITEKKVEKSKKKKKRDSSDEEEEEEPKKKRGPQVVTYQKQLVSRVSQQVSLTDISPIKKAFVNPELLLFKSNSGVGSTSISGWRSYSAELWLENEGQRFSASSDGNFTDIDAIRKQWVSFCVKNYTAEDDAIVKQVMKLTEMGKAGLLGDLVGVFGGELASASLKTLTSFIPI